MTVSSLRSRPDAAPRPSLSSVASPADLVGRIQRAISILARPLRVVDADPHSVYHDLLLMTARLLFVQASTPRRRGRPRIQEAVDRLRFLRARRGAFEPCHFPTDVVEAAFAALDGAGTLTPHGLGSACETLMAFHPVVTDGAVEFATVAGNARKTTGSYYTPDSLIHCLLDTALEPVLDRPGVDLTQVAVCDPSCGSGQFLLAAADRIADRLARHGKSPEEARTLAVRQCLYGVDLNPLAVELCRFHLWLAGADEAEVQHRIRWGDSLLGATPELVSKGIPSTALTALEGDDAAVVRGFAKEARGGRPVAGPFTQGRADAWCALFVWPRHPGAPPPPLHLALGDGQPEAPETLLTLERIVQERRFLHWPLEFPEVFARGGFDVVLGNPPWERIEVQDKEWFARRSPDIAAALNSAQRKRLVAALAQTDPEGHVAFVAARRKSQAELHFIRHSGRYPLTGRGGVNRYAPFTETCRMLVAPRGRVGYVVPSGLVHDDTTRAFFQDLMASASLRSLYHFDNRKKLFPAVGGMITFCLLTFSGKADRSSVPASFVCFAQSPSDLQESQRRFHLSADDLALLNPNSRTLPIFRTRTDFELTRHIYRKVPVLIERGGANPWDVELSMLFQMSGDSHRFRTSPAPDYVPLYEAKMMHQYDHRWATWQDGRAAGADDRSIGYEVQPRYWVPRDTVEARLQGRWDQDWLLVWRDVCRSTDERTVIASIVPRVGVGHTCQLLMPGRGSAAVLLANLNSLVLDYVARQKVGGIHLTYNYLEQLPIVPPEAYEGPAPWQPEMTLRTWIEARVMELTCTSHSVAAFGNDRTFPWDPQRRALLKAELDAAFCILYGLSDAQVRHVLSTFPILKRKEQARHGEYRTGRLVLEALKRLRRS